MMPAERVHHACKRALQLDRAFLLAAAVIVVRSVNTVNHFAGIYRLPGKARSLEVARTLIHRIYHSVNRSSLMADFLCGTKEVEKYAYLHKSNA